jgi:hypothetical protein
VVDLLWKTSALAAAKKAKGAQMIEFTWIGDDDLGDAPVLD